MRFTDTSDMQAYYAALSTDNSVVGKCSMSMPPFDLSGKRVLDVFCRGGKGAYKLAAHVGVAGAVVGVDPSVSCIEQALGYTNSESVNKNTSANSPSFLVAFPEALHDAGIADESFDVVYINSAINLCWDIRQALESFCNVLVPNGVLWVAEGIFRDQGSLAGTCDCAGHCTKPANAGNVFERAFSVENFQNLCLAAGFLTCDFGSKKAIVADGGDETHSTEGVSFVTMNACVRRG